MKTIRKKAYLVEETKTNIYKKIIHGTILE